MYCGTSTTWNGNMIVPSMSPNRIGLKRKSRRANAYAATEHENRLPMTDSPAMTAELRKNLEKGMPRPSQPCTQLSSVSSRGQSPGSEKISWLGLNELDS